MQIFCCLAYDLKFSIVLPNWNIFSYFSFLFRFFILSLQSISIRSHYVEWTMFPLCQDDDIEPTQCGIRDVFNFEAFMNEAGSVEEITT